MVFRVAFYSDRDIKMSHSIFQTILKYFFCALLAFSISNIVASIFISEVNFETAYFSRKKYSTVSYFLNLRKGKT